MFKLIIKLLTAFIFINAVLVSQTKIDKKLSVYLGLGVNYGITQDFKDYLIASIPYSSSDSIKSFNAGVEFFGGSEYLIGKKISIGIDYSYYIRSLSYNYYQAVFDYNIINHQPYIILNYNLIHQKYSIKAGISAGYHFQKLENKVNPQTTLEYRSSGTSLRLMFSFMPKLSKNSFIYANGFAYLNLYNNLKDKEGNLLIAPNSNKTASLKGYGVGVRLGIAFLLF